MRRVVITGIGAVSPLGNDLPSTIGGALEGASGIRRCDARLWGRAGARLRCWGDGLVEGVEAARYLPAGHSVSCDSSTVVAIAAAEEALGDADLELPKAAKARTGVLIGTAAPGNETYHQAMHAAFVEEAAHALPGHMLLQLSGNIHSGVIALRHGLTGPNFSVVDACATGATALSLAADQIRLGRADRMLAGGVDAPIGLTVFGSMLNAGAMRPTADPERACCPFSPDRAGLILGEGGAVFVLETFEDAQARGAHIYGELLGEAMTNDAHHLYSPAPEGVSWERTMRLALDRAGVTPDEVGAISAHAASTPLGDLCETLAIKRLLGARAMEVPVVASKSQIGHTLGAGGALELAMMLGALERGSLPPTIGRQPDPRCDRQASPVAQAAAPEVLVKNSFGFAGTNTSMVIRRVAQSSRASASTSGRGSAAS